MYKWIVYLVFSGFLLLGCNKQEQTKKEKLTEKKPSYTDLVPTKEAKFDIEKPTEDSHYSNGYGSWKAKIDGKEVTAPSAILSVPKEFRVVPSGNNKTTKELDSIDIKSTGIKTWEGETKVRDDIP